MNEQEAFSLVSNMARAASAVVGQQDSVVGRVLQLVGLVADSAATIAETGGDSVAHIERILADDEMIRRVKEDRDAALLEKFGEGE